ncbi:MAG: DUF2029 domain-containing protein [Planctomycetes bacterium]|nr:DUF2029 domain-containing protein [Planctomycetota bacterium]
MPTGDDVPTDALRPRHRRVADFLRAHVWQLAWCALGVFLVLRTGRRTRGVITDHLEFGRRLAAGEWLYAPFQDHRPLHPVYPPSFGLLTWPFAELGERIARYAWGLLQVGALWVIGVVLLDWLRARRPGLWPRRHLLLALVCALAGRYVLRDTHGGGGNLINVALVLGAAACAERGRWRAGALLLGLSLATKPTMALFVPVLWLCGHRRAAAGSLAIAGGLAALAVAINAQGLEPFRYWAEGALAYGRQQDLYAPALHDLPPFTWMNQSLRCMVARYLGTVPAAYAAQVPGFVQGAGLAPDVTATIARLAGLAVVGLALWCAHRWRGDRDGRRRALALAFVASLLVSPISWKAHHVALIPAFLLLASDAWLGAGGARRLAIAYFVVCSAGGGDLVGDAVKEWQQSLYVATLGSLALLGWLVGTARRQRRASTSMPAADAAAASSGGSAIGT